MRCNVGTFANAAKATTISIAAGSTVGFVADIPVFHPGPFTIYMAKAPAAASAFDGSGSVWFKVWQKGATSITTSAITFDIS